jgi:endo-beta-N-acetylglucosaminidase D
MENLEGRAVPSGAHSLGLTVAPRLSARHSQQSVPTFSVDNVTVLYAPSGPRTAVITVTRSGPTNRPASVMYATEDGTAKAKDVDYLRASGTLHFGAGRVSATISVTVAPAPSPPTDPDKPPAPDTFFYLGLSKPVHAALGAHSKAEILIHNDAGSDSRPTIKPISAYFINKGKDGNDVVEVNLDKEFYGWRTYEGADQANQRPSVATVPLQKRLPGPATSPPVLAGFDMGDWQYDPYFTEWSQGGSGSATSTLPGGTVGYRTAADVYNFSFWNRIDISYYFGHNFLTIPPTVWTDAAHANGVLSLGTLFLGDDTGHVQLHLPETALEGKNLQKFASTAEAIAHYYGFDGYLINDEVFPPDYPDANQSLELMETLKADGLTLIWYDSPTSGGYANYLNPGAVPFLKAAGDFQANYEWPSDSASPEGSYETLKENFSSPLKERDHVFSALYPYDNKYGADSVVGLWNTTFFQDYGNAIQTNPQGFPPNYYTGIGVYAPDFTLFKGHASNQETLPPAMQFQRIDQAFWTGTGYDVGTTKPVYEPGDLTPVPQDEAGDSLAAIQTTVDSKVITTVVTTPRSAVDATPFLTDFNTGEGTFYNWLGAAVAKNAWNNLANQSILPTNLAAVSQAGAPQSVAEYHYDDAYIGGSCLNVYSPTVATGARVTYHLFNTNLMGSKLTNVTFTVKPSGTRVSFVPKVMVDLWTGVGQGQQLTSLRCRRVGEQNGWITFEATVPSSFADKAITGVGLTLKNASALAQPLDLNIGQMRLLNQAKRSGQPHVFYFQPQHGGVLNWIHEGFNSASTYNIYGYLGGKYYLLGTTRGYSYNAEGIILNRSLNGFTKFAVQEVNAGGEFKRLSGHVAHFG